MAPRGLEAPRPERLGPIATLPLFYKLRGRPAVLAGGGAPAAWKAELLSAAGAAVAVYAPEPSPEMAAVAAAPADGPITLHARAWTPPDLVGAALALGDCESEEEAAAFRSAAHAAGVPVNVIDKPAYCDFQFGTLVSRSPLLVGISTDGAAPVLGQAIRTRIEALLPPGLTAWAAAAQAWRPAFQARRPDFRARRRFWSAFADRALAGPDRAPSDADQAACLAAAFGADDGRAGSPVVLIGAGPGTLDGMTLAAVRALQNADVIVHPADLPAGLLGLGRREARAIALPSSRSSDAATMVANAADGPAVVVWLDRGNPARCLEWKARAAGLAGRGQQPVAIEGLGRCLACRAGCPDWPADASGQTSFFTA